MRVLRLPLEQVLANYASIWISFDKRSSLFLKKCKIDQKRFVTLAPGPNPIAKQLEPKVLLSRCFRVENVVNVSKFQIRILLFVH